MFIESRNDRRCGIDRDSDRATIGIASGIGDNSAEIGDN